MKDFNSKVDYIKGNINNYRLIRNIIFLDLKFINILKG